MPAHERQVEGWRDMTQTLDAVFENGACRLLEPASLQFSEGQHVRLTVETEAATEDVLALAQEVYAGLSDEEIDEIERIALDRRPLFGDREP